MHCISLGSFSPPNQVYVCLVIVSSLNRDTQIILRPLRRVPDDRFTLPISPMLEGAEDEHSVGDPWFTVVTNRNPHLFVLMFMKVKVAILHRF
jgi:hypothetical protein